MRPEVIVRGVRKAGTLQNLSDEQIVRKFNRDLAIEKEVRAIARHSNDTPWQITAVVRMTLGNL